jgi:hypothetical protein
LSAVASTPAIEPTLKRPRLEPMVLVDGFPESRLRLTYATYEGPLDRRRVILAIDWEATASLRARWQRALVTVALPQRLADDQVRWCVLAQGTLREAEDHETVGQRQRAFNLADAWNGLLDQPGETIPWVDAQGGLVAQPNGRFALGEAANRSRKRVIIGGQSVHVFQRNGVAWTVRTALETLSAIGGLNLALHTLPRSIADAPLPESLDLTEPIGDALRALLESHGLVVQRELRWASGALIERRAVRPVTSGRPVTVRWAESDQPLSDVLRINRDAPRDAAQPWVARGAGWLVESTFELVGGWDPALAGQSDSEYGRTTSSDFSRYANVYRYWVLNEDSAFTDAPFNRGAPFDLTAFFDDGAVRPQPLRFRDCVTLDDAANRLAPIVEVSTDGGATWHRYSGDARLATTRAAVYLDDATLPSAFLTAAQNDQARVRVTAALRAPQPVTERRWRGNPFVGQRPARVFDLSETFRFQRVKPASIHRAAIDAGTLDAAEVNQRRELAGWLVDRMARADAALTDKRGRATLNLAGAWPMLRIGDQLLSAGGPDDTLDRQRQRVAQRGGVIDSITVHFPVDTGQGPNTTIRLHFD